MWLLFLLIGANSCLSNNLINGTNLRITVGGFPVNIFDILIVVGVLVTLLPHVEGYVRLERPHPAVIWLIGLVFLAAGGAGIMATSNGATAREITTTARNLIELPLLVYLGYRLIPRLHSATTYCWLTVWAGIIATACITISFGDRAQELRSDGSVEMVRVVQYISNYGGIASAILLFSLGAGTQPLARSWIAIPVAACCYVGEFSTLSRSDWLALTGGIFAGILVMPAYRLWSKLGFAFVVFPAIMIVLWGAIYVASSISGKDVQKTLIGRFQSMLPGEHEGVKGHAWDSRVDSSVEELKIWAGSPLIGGGFGIQDVHAAEDGLMGYRHNAWTATLAESGLFGFAAMVLLCVGQIVVGRRLIRDRLDRSSILIGGLGVITGAHYIVHGLCSMSFNQVRWGAPLALTFGVVMRCRAIQLETLKQYEGYLPEQPELGMIPPAIDEYPIHGF